MVICYVSVYAHMYILIFFKILFIYLLERGEGKERGRETSMCGYLSESPTGDLALNPGICPD